MEPNNRGGEATRRLIQLELSNDMVQAGLKQLEESHLFVDSDFAVGSMEEILVAKIFVAMAKASSSPLEICRGPDLASIHYDHVP